MKYNLTFIAATTLFALLHSTPLAADEIRHGLNMEIFATRRLTSSVEKRIIPNVDCHWKLGGPSEAAPVNNFSVRFTGWLKAPSDGQYKITVVHDDGVRIWLDGRNVLDKWKPSKNSSAFVVELTKEPQTIRVEYFDGGSLARIGLQWQAVGAVQPSIIPSEAFFPDEQSAKQSAKGNKAKENRMAGLKVQYFDEKFKRKLRTSRLPKAETFWGLGAAEPGLPADAAARYSGYVVAPRSGHYTFHAWGDDGLRFWIDEKPTLECKWNRDGTPAQASVRLTAGQPHAIRIDFVDVTNSGGWLLHWTPPGKKKQISIPPEFLFQSKQAAEEFARSVSKN